MVNSGLLASSTPEVTEVKGVVKESPYVQMILDAAAKNEVNPKLALAISECESHLRQFSKDGSVLRGEVNPADVGLFQINEDWHLEDSKKLGFNIYSASGNIDYALHILKKDGARHWTYSKPCWGGKVSNHQVSLAK